MSTNIALLPVVTVAAVSSQDGDCALPIAFSDESGPIDITGIAFSILWRASTGGPLVFLPPSSGAVTANGGASSIVTFTAPLSAMARLGPGTYVGSLVAVADGRTEDLGVWTLTHSAIGPCLVTSITTTPRNTASANSVGYVPGPQGIQGIQGPQGTQGPQGAQGPQGSQGLTGPAVSSMLSSAISDASSAGRALLTAASSVVQKALLAITSADIGDATASGKAFLTSVSAAAQKALLSIVPSDITGFDAQVRASRLDQMSAPAATVSWGGYGIINLADPTSAQGVATKNYVDTVAQGLDPKAHVLCATTANITLSGEQTIDGIATSSSRVLVKNQTSVAQNGVYVSGSGAWSRSSDSAAWSQLVSAYVFVQRGTLNGDCGFTCISDDGGTIGTTAVAWAQFSGAGTYTAGSNLTQSGTQFSLSATYAGQASIITLGTVTTGAWQGTPVAASYGGTGQTIYAVGDLLYASGAGALSKLAAVATGNVLISGGVATAASWGKVDLTVHVAAVLPKANGGLGAATLAAALDSEFGSARGLLLVRGAAGWSALALGANGTTLQSNGTDLAYAAASPGAGALRYDTPQSLASGQQDQVRQNVGGAVPSTPSTSATLGAADISRDLYATGTIALTMPNGGAGWRSGIIANDNAASGVVTLAIPSGHALDGISNGTRKLYPFQRAYLTQITATAWRTTWVQREPVVASWAWTADVASFDLTLPAGFPVFEMTLAGRLQTNGSSTDLALRVSTNNGSSFDSGSNYGVNGNGSSGFGGTYSYAIIGNNMDRSFVGRSIIYPSGQAMDASEITNGDRFAISTHVGGDRGDYGDESYACTYFGSNAVRATTIRIFNADGSNLIGGTVIVRGLAA